jgi:hypothetical protein
VVAAEDLDPGAVAEPVQHEDHLVTAGELSAPGRGAPRSRSAAGTPGKVAAQFRSDVGEITSVVRRADGHATWCPQWVARDSVPGPGFERARYNPMEYRACCPRLLMLVATITIS